MRWLALYAQVGGRAANGPAGPSGRSAHALEVLAPIVKSWPSEFRLEANSIAIQVHGGYGYTRDFPVEQFWRDSRLNIIHEGAHGTQVWTCWAERSCSRMAPALSCSLHASGKQFSVPPMFQAWLNTAKTLSDALGRLRRATAAAWSTGLPEGALAIANPYLRGFGHLVLAWMWLDVRSPRGTRSLRTGMATSSGASSPQHATSSATNCRRSTLGWPSLQLATQLAEKCRTSGLKKETLETSNNVQKLFDLTSMLVTFTETADPQCGIRNDVTRSARNGLWAYHLLGYFGMTLLRRTADRATQRGVLSSNTSFSSLDVRWIFIRVRHGRIVASPFDLNQLFAYLRSGERLVRLRKDRNRSSKDNGN